MRALLPCTPGKLLSNHISVRDTCLRLYALDLVIWSTLAPKPFTLFAIWRAQIDRCVGQRHPFTFMNK